MSPRCLYSHYTHIVIRLVNFNLFYKIINKSCSFYFFLTSFRLYYLYSSSFLLPKSLVRIRLECMCETEKESCKEKYQCVALVDIV